MDLYDFDKKYFVENICGVDEAGRGPLAGDVFAAAVVLDNKFPIIGINDSKKLSEKKRNILYDEIVEKSIVYSISSATIQEIESLNILNATMLAMKRAIEQLRDKININMILVDGNKCPILDNNDIHSKFVINGDCLSASIAAASILAKVSRDRYMVEKSKMYPEYFFEKHKGYGTKLHYKMIDQNGLCDIHRNSFLKKYFIKKSNKSDEQSNRGEYIAQKYLFKKGYNIIRTNFRVYYGEIDIIAIKDDIIYFIEVKQRKTNSLYRPYEAVNISKKDKIIKTSLLFLSENKEYAIKQSCFSIIEVYISKDEKIKINYIIDAFN